MENTLTDAPEPARVPRQSRARQVGALALCAAVVLLLPLGRLVPGMSLAAQAGREAIFWGMTLAILGYVLGVERRPLSSVGLRLPNWRSLAFGLMGAVVLTGGSALIYTVLLPALGLAPNSHAMAQIMATPVWFRLIVVIRAAVFEELCFRGFMIERVSEVTGLRWLAAVISLVAFTLEHLSFWGWVQLVVAGFGGLILTGLYLLRRDLASNMLAHFVPDFVGIVAGAAA